MSFRLFSYTHQQGSSTTMQSYADSLEDFCRRGAAALDIAIHSLTHDSNGFECVFLCPRPLTGDVGALCISFPFSTGKITVSRGRIAEDAYVSIHSSAASNTTTAAGWWQGNLNLPFRMYRVNDIVFGIQLRWRSSTSNQNTLGSMVMWYVVQSPLTGNSYGVSLAYAPNTGQIYSGVTPPLFDGGYTGSAGHVVYDAEYSRSFSCGAAGLCYGTELARTVPDNKIMLYPTTLIPGENQGVRSLGIVTVDGGPLYVASARLSTMPYEAEINGQNYVFLDYMAVRSV